MKTANELRKLTEEARNEQIRLFQEDVKSFVEELMGPMEEAAACGKAWLPKVQLPMDVFFKKEVKKILEELGYRVEDAIAIGCINIYWDAKKAEGGDE